MSKKWSAPEEYLFYKMIRRRFSVCLWNLLCWCMRIRITTAQHCHGSPNLRHSAYQLVCAISHVRYIQGRHTKYFQLCLLFPGMCLPDHPAEAIGAVPNPLQSWSLHRRRLSGSSTSLWGELSAVSIGLPLFATALETAWICCRAEMPCRGDDVGPWAGRDGLPAIHHDVKIPAMHHTRMQDLVGCHVI